MTIEVNNPFLSYKAAIKIALGNKDTKRPIFKERNVNSITLTDSTDDYQFVFGDLNYEYVNNLPTDDLSVLTDEEYGKFFYEYGRTILANLMVCITKADWNSVEIDSNGVAQYLANYHNNLLVLQEKAKEVIANFKKEAISETEYLLFNINENLYSAEWLIRNYKTEVQKSRDSDDMRNIDIFYCAYIGLLYTLYGLFIVLTSVITEKSGFDIFSFMKHPKSASFNTVYEVILKEASLGNDEKKHLISLIYAFYKMTDFYRATSGLDKMDAMVGTMYDISKSFVEKIENNETETAKILYAFIDDELTEFTADGAVSLKSFTDFSDPLLDTMYFRRANIISNDNTNIFDFGRVYLRGYINEYVDGMENNLGEKENLFTKDYVKPAIKFYIERSIKPAYTNEDVERAFGVIKNLLTGIEDKDLFSRVEPGFILQLVMFASTFRVLYNRSTQRSDKARNEINSAIDILDVMILKLYNIWFKSHKYYIQSNRPDYCHGRDGINSTLGYLKEETDGILKYYFEFVRYGIGSIADSDADLYKEFLHNQVVDVLKDFSTSWINDNIQFISNETFIKSCADKNGRTIVQCAILDDEKSFENIVKSYSNKELPKYAIKSLTSKPEEYTGIDIIDRIIDNSYMAKRDVDSFPEVYTVMVFASLYFTVDMLFRKFNTGNYFDFGAADLNIGSYNIEHTVAKLIGAPLKNAIAFEGL